jgi:dienelactone hydrolase
VARVVLAAVLFIVGLLGIFYWGFNESRELPTPSGPFGVGRVTYAASGGKSLALVVWYPATKGSSATPAPYNPAIGGRLLDSQADPMEQNLASVHDHAIAGAGISDARRRFPVIVFWPGYGWQPSRYAILAEGLASNGYVVAGISPDYKSGSLADTISSRRLVEGWAAQMVSVVTRLDSLNDSPTPPLAGHLDLKRVGFFGHSIGGAVSIQACTTFDRCAGAIDLDGSVFGSVVASGTTKPVLFIMGEAYRPPDLPGFRGARATFDSSTAYDARTIGNILGRSPKSAKVMIPGFRHAFFTDEAAFFDPLAPIAMVLGGQTDALNGLDNVSVNARAFFDRLLNPELTSEPLTGVR